MRRVLLVYDLYMDGRRNALGGYELGMRLCGMVWRAVRGAAAATAAAWLCSCAAQIAHVDGGDAESQRAERVECQTSTSASADVGDYGAASFNRAGWLTDFGKSSVRLSEIVSGGVGRDQIRPIDEPQSVPVSEAGRMFESDEAVIALEVGGERRAYPLSDRNKRSGITHFCLWLDSIEKTGEELAAAGFPDALVGPPSDVRSGLTPGSDMRVSMIMDPEGNPIEVFERA